MKIKKLLAVIMLFALMTASNIFAQDLVISTGAPTATPSTVAPGGTVVLSAWTVLNQGTVSTGVGISNGFYLSTNSTITTLDTYLDGNSNSSLAAGASFNWGGPTVTIPIGTTPGTYYLGFLVDRNDAVTESDETNNYVSVAITVEVALDIEELNLTGLPTNYQLSQNYPNPFNPSTTIEFDVPRSSFVSIDIYNQLGQKVNNLVHQKVVAGSYRVDWDGRDNMGNQVATGIYFYRMQAGDYIENKKMILLK